MSERLDFKGDYMGFSYGVTQSDGTEKLTHSSTLGIVRTSDGSRFNENLLPTMQDKIVQVPGGDGSYYFGSYYTQRQFNVSFAFDSLTEVQIAEIRRVFGDKKIHDLIFDETPYKVYSAKVTGSATIKYLAFNDGDTGRLYKGEGSLQFTCYYPFARCWSADINEYANHPAYQGLSVEECNARIEEWQAAARIESNKNFGDVPVPFTLDISSTDEEKTVAVNGTTLDWTKLPKDTSGTINTKTGLVKSTTGDILNEYVSGNTTVKIPVGENVPGAQFTCLYI